MKNPLKSPAVKNLLDPVLRLLAICAAVALALGLVNLFTDPIIREAALREKTAALSQLSGPASRSVAHAGFPLEMDPAAYETLRADASVTPDGRSLMDRWYERTAAGRYIVRKGMTVEEAAALAAGLEKSAVARKGKVRAWYILKTGNEVSGFLLELAGSGYGGQIDIVAAYKPDGAVRTFKVLKADESPSQSKQIRSDDYARHFAGTRGAAVPVVKAMLNRSSADAISGATISFMAVGGAVKEGSLFVIAIGGE
jgi:Na+-translocating ferredoxin:NAD+ oxidoreductase RnfG subunit